LAPGFEQSAQDAGVPKKENYRVNVGEW
jgi:hypothetical protein